MRDTGRHAAITLRVYFFSCIVLVHCGSGGGGDGDTVATAEAAATAGLQLDGGNKWAHSELPLHQQGLASNDRLRGMLDVAHRSVVGAGMRNVTRASVSLRQAMGSYADVVRVPPPLSYSCTQAPPLPLTPLSTRLAFPTRKFTSHLGSSCVDRMASQAKALHHPVQPLEQELVMLRGQLLELGAAVAADVRSLESQDSDALRSAVARYTALGSTSTDRGVRRVSEH
eukprot:COSAG01_NODE_10812_length_2075_cov_2.018219_2_plen_227_part_00